MKITEEEVSKRFVDIYYQLYAKRVLNSKREFCQSLGIFNYSYIEKGQRRVSLRNICDVINLYNVSAEWLFYGKGEIFNQCQE